MRIPSEWSRHSATQMHWPLLHNTWTPEQLSKIEKIYCKLIEELHFFEPIHLFVENLEVRNHVMQKLSERAVDLDRVIVHQQETGGAWARDCGLFFLNKEGKSKIFDFHTEENAHVESTSHIPKYVSEKFGLQRFKGSLILSNNWLDSNGAGALLISESPVLEVNGRNGLSKTEIEHKLKRQLGLKTIIWLKNVANNANAELPARWLKEDTVAVMTGENPDIPDFDILQENLEILNSASLNNGSKLQVATFPCVKLKREKVYGESFSLAHANYANFYIVNGAVFVPLFGQQEDEKAMELFRNYFPGRKIIEIESTDFALMGGSLRRATLPWFGTKAKF